MQANTKRWIKRVLLGGAVVFVLGAGLTVYLLQRPPAVWREAQAVLEQTTPQEQAELTEGVMQRLAASANLSQAKLVPRDPRDATQPGSAQAREALAELANQPIDETFELELSNEELLAVARGWADQWIAQRGYALPEQMDLPVVMIRNGELMMAFEIVVGQWRQVFSGKVAMRFDADGMAHGRVSELTAGSLPLPVATVGDWIANQLPASQADHAGKIGRWIAELEDFEFRPVLELEHRRRARVLAMKVRDQSLVMTMRLQDHQTYKTHNTLMKAGSVAVHDVLGPALLDGSAIADVPTTTD